MNESLESSFRRLRWVVIAAPLLVVAVLEYSRWALGPLLESWLGRLTMDAVVVVGAVTFYAVVSSVIAQLMERLGRQNRELQSLQDASLAISPVLSLDSVLTRIVEQARVIVNCRYGALAVYDLEGRLESFVTSGIDEQTRQQIGAPPSGKGLLRLPLREGQHLRLQDLASHPRSSGFPEGHPQMRSLLAVPVICHQPFRGNLYLSEKIDGTELTEEDEQVLSRFAVQAAIAVDNAQLHSKVAGMAVMDERLRLAREMHDGQAQVLAYVNTKAQVVDQLLAQGEVERAREHLSQMAAAAREVYADVREGILGLRTALDSDHDLAQGIRDFAHSWQDQCGIPVELEIEGEARYRPEAELQILRVLQESLANVRKHSRADRVTVRVRLEPERLSLDVEDDGQGFDLDAESSGALTRFGLSTMAERCETIRAQLDIQTRVGHGTKVSLCYAPESSSSDARVMKSSGGAS